MVISLAAVTIYCLPVVAAINQNSYLPAQLSSAFNYGQDPGDSNKPFSFIKMFTGISVTDIAPTVITYKTVDGKGLTLDLYPSSSKQKSPLILIVHGGSWESGDSKQFIDFNNYFANRGYNVAAINYRLAPAYRSPAPMDDTKDAIAYLTRNSDKYNIDTSNIILIGRSAGAQIALVAAYVAHNRNIKGVIDFYGPADMVWGGQVKVNKLMLNTNQIYKDYFGGVYSEVPQVFKENSAVDCVDSLTMPTLIIHGSIDAMVSHIHSEHLNDTLSRHNVPHYFFSLPFATHGCDYIISSPGGQVTTYAVEQFIHAVIKK